MASFNLVHERWIPCQILEDGSTLELNLRDTLCRSHQIKEIHDPSPLVTIAIHRLLLAVLHRVFGPASLTEWQTLWQRGAWEENKLEAYFSQWSDRFDLFHPQHPFYQDPWLFSKVKKKKKLSKVSEEKQEDEEGQIPFAKLARELATSRNATLFDHNTDAFPKAFSFSEAARYLIADQFYAIPDGTGYRTSPLTYGVTTLVCGSSLFETLMLNLLPYNSERPIPSNLSKDRPWWEYAAQEAPGAIPHGYLSYLTWPYRRAFLLVKDSSVTHTLREATQGVDKAWIETLFDPMVSYSRSKTVGFQPVKLQEGKALWRESHALLGLLSHKYGKEPGVIAFLAKTGTRQTTVHVLGAKADNNSIALWRHERLPLPLAYLEDRDLLNGLKPALDTSKKVGITLSWATDLFARLALNHPESGSLKKQAKKEVDNLVKSLNLEAAYWPALESPFKRFMVDLAEQWPSYDPDAEDHKQLPAQQEWIGQVERAARTAFDTATSGLDISARTLKGLAQAERAFNIHLRRILNATT
jgi:CRISPR system Cascade subunit CasA